jgi:hypothetical protein
MKSKLVTYLTTLTAVLALGTAQAATPKKGEAKADAKTEPAKGDAPKRDTYPLYGEVVSITAKTLTIKGGVGKEDRKYAITADTVFKNVNKEANIDKPATAADVKAGNWVGGLLKKTPGAADDAVMSINIGVKQKDEAEAKKAETGTKKAETKTTKKKAA